MCMCSCRSLRSRLRLGVRKRAMTSLMILRRSVGSWLLFSSGFISPLIFFPLFINRKEWIRALHPQRTATPGGEHSAPCASPCKDTRTHTPLSSGDLWHHWQSHCFSCFHGSFRDMTLKKEIFPAATDSRFIRAVRDIVLLTPLYLIYLTLSCTN